MSATTQEKTRWIEVLNIHTQAGGSPSPRVIGPLSFTTKGKPWTWASNGDQLIAVNEKLTAKKDGLMSKAVARWMAQRMVHEETTTVIELRSRCKVKEAKHYTSRAFTIDKRFWLSQLRNAFDSSFDSKRKELLIGDHIIDPANLFMGLFAIPDGPCVLRWNDDRHDKIRIDGDGWVVLVMPMKR